ncbi:MAG: alpha/beta fold hydrolase [Gemmatimonadota bacterium]|nr:alpha/beta fold hydrolase [Gemmatimonadota bacterium]
MGVGLGTGAPPLAWRRQIDRTPIVGMPVVGSTVAFRSFVMPDSVPLYATQYFAHSRGTIVVLHGLGAHDSLAAQTGDSLRRLSGLNVLFLDLRGNGRSGGARGWLDHDAQYHDDLATVVRELKRANPSGPVLLLGVQQGAGPALGYAARANVPPVQGLALIDPLLTLGAIEPATTDDGPPLQWHTRRRRTQQLLNRLGLHMADRLPVAYQLMRRPDGAVTRRYSWRAIRALLPRDPWATINALALPVLLIDRRSPADARVARTDRHQMLSLPPDASRWSAATWRAFERWTAPFAADAALGATILPFVPVPVFDTGR